MAHRFLNSARIRGLLGPWSVGPCSLDSGSGGQSLQRIFSIRESVDGINHHYHQSFLQRCRHQIYSRIRISRRHESLYSYIALPLALVCEPFSTTTSTRIARSSQASPRSVNSACAWLGDHKSTAPARATMRPPRAIAGGLYTIRASQDPEAKPTEAQDKEGGLDTKELSSLRKAKQQVVL